MPSKDISEKIINILKYHPYFKKMEYETNDIEVDIEVQIVKITVDGHKAKAYPLIYANFKTGEVNTCLNEIEPFKLHFLQSNYKNNKLNITFLYTGKINTNGIYDDEKLNNDHSMEKYFKQEEIIEQYEELMKGVVRK